MTKPVKHLWEVDHPYYCNQGNYFATGGQETSTRYKSWAEFFTEEGDCDPDYNLLFRWDWQEGELCDAAEFNGDVNYRNGVLLLFWMGQRKGLYRWSEVEVCRADEPAVREFLQSRFDYLKRVWEPLT
jgi:hypothetical protein